MQVHEIVVKVLGAQDSPVFGLMGDANMLYLAKLQDAGHTFVPVAHEGSSVGAADAYFRLTGRVGLASVTHGPALTNTMTSLVEAARAHSSLVLLTGDTPQEATHFQRVDIAAIAAAAGAGYDKLYRPDTAARDLTRALQTAIATRRPVVVDIPFAMLHAETKDLESVPPVHLTPPRPVTHEQLDDALGALVAARRPVVLAGRGAVEAGARDALIALADRLGAPLATTLQAKGFFTGHPRNIGIFGSFSHSVASGVIGDSDCIAAFGASLNVYTAGGGKLTRGKNVIHVDEDPTRFGQFTRPNEAVLGDARLAAEAILELLQEAGHTGGQQWGDQVATALAEWTPHGEFQDRSTGQHVDPRAAVVRLNELLPPDRVVVNDIGRFVAAAWPYLDVTDARAFVNMGAFGGIGLGMGGLVGAAHAAGDRLVVGVLGDGGFMMNPTELVALVKSGARILLVILDDGAYGAEHYKLIDYGVDPDYSLTGWPDLAGVTTALGAHSATITALDQLDAVPGLLAEHRVVAIDVRLDPEMNIVDGH